MIKLVNLADRPSPQSFNHSAIQPFLPKPIRIPHELLVPADEAVGEHIKDQRGNNGVKAGGKITLIVGVAEGLTFVEGIVQNNGHYGSHQQRINGAKAHLLQGVALT